MALKLSGVSFQYTILPEQRLILVRFQKSVSVVEFVASASVICSDARYVRGFDGLIDLTAVGVAISPADIKDLVEFTSSKRKHGHGKWAVLVTTPASTAFTMLFQQGVSREHPFSVFSTFAGASSFLGRPMDSTMLAEALAVP